MFSNWNFGSLPAHYMQENPFPGLIYVCLYKRVVQPRYIILLKNKNNAKLVWSIFIFHLRDISRLRSLKTSTKRLTCSFPGWCNRSPPSDWCGVFRLWNSNSDQTKGILPFSESALWVIITRHHQVDGQNHDRLIVTVTAYLSPHLCTEHVSVLPGRATRANIDRCYIMSRSLAFLTCQRCLSSDHSSKKYTQKIFPQSDRITTLIWAGWKTPEGGEKTLMFDSRWAGELMFSLFSIIS